MSTCQNSRNIRNLVCELQKELAKNGLCDTMEMKEIFDNIFMELDELEDFRDCNSD